MSDNEEMRELARTLDHLTMDVMKQSADDLRIERDSLKSDLSKWKALADQACAELADVKAKLAALTAPTGDAELEGALAWAEYDGSGEPYDEDGAEATVLARAYRQARDEIKKSHHSLTVTAKELDDARADHKAATAELAKALAERNDARAALAQAQDIALAQKMALAAKDVEACIGRDGQHKHFEAEWELLKEKDAEIARLRTAMDAAIGEGGRAPFDSAQHIYVINKMRAHLQTALSSPASGAKP
jgi:peptidoglycan hydrolase CwlO-like protein